MLGGKTDRAGRVTVSAYLNVPDAPDVFVVGDTASVMQDGHPVPGVAQAAIQQGRCLGRCLSGKNSRRVDRGDHGHLATNQLCSQSRQLVIVSVGPSIFDRRIPAFVITGNTEAATEWPTVETLSDKARLNLEKFVWSSREKQRRKKAKIAMLCERAYDPMKGR